MSRDEDKPTFEDMLEDFLQDLDERENHPPKLRSEKQEEIREWIQKRHPFVHPERYIGKDIKGLDEFKQVLALTSISPFSPIHVVAIGDPATGKSQIAQAFQDLTPRTRYCLGSKMTAAGLTLARLGNRVMVGVLPACHIGAAYIDEFNLTPPDDAAAVLSTMQDGYFSVDKAFLKADYVPAKVSIVAMANPRGDYWISANPHQIRRQMPFRSLALLTRFHIIYIVLRPSVEEFGEISEHQLKFHMGLDSCSFDERERELWKSAVEALRYFRPKWGGRTKTKRRLIAAFTMEAYRQERRRGVAIPVSPRLNEGVSNLAEAFARANMREDIRMRDVMEAIRLAVNSLIACGLDPAPVKKRLAEVLKPHA
jgi:DNA replicative helicase MCM subunit Mcm2 (Cdc46/Mcm family)